MSANNTTEISQELFQVMKQFSRVKWENRAYLVLKPSESELLGTLYLVLDNGKRGVPASDLSNQLNITPAAVTHLLNPLEDGGFIKRHKDPQDRRFVLVGLTAKGRKYAETMLATESENMARLVAHLGKENSKTLLRLMSSTVNFFADRRALDLEAD
jgi:DNA-binding MarR family transcriptional regulator